MRTIIEKLLTFLHIRSSAAGLEVSDQVVRLTYFDGKVWRLHAVRLEPGAMSAGKIINRAAFLSSLSELKEQVGGKGKSTNIVLCLGSTPSYTQVFSLPAVHGEDFNEAVELNLKMASPLEAGKAYSGWQVVGRDENTLQSEVLSAFIDRQMVDDMVNALFDAGFLTMAVESRALALTRVLREKGAGIDVSKPYILVSIDNDGLDFLVIRNGALYFEYVEPWRDLVDDKGEILMAKFKETLAASARQVVNFYRQHWQDPLAAVIISAAAFEKEAEEAIAPVIQVPAMRLTLVMGQAVSSEWLAAIGCSLRGRGLKANAQEISLLGEASQDRFHEEQLLGFMRFWRVVIPVVFGILLITFGVADAFLISTKQAVESRSDFKLGGSQAAEISSLKASASTFNQMVGLVSAAERSASPKSILLSKLASAAAANNVTISRITFQSFNTPVALSGSGPAQSDVVAFKSALDADHSFSAIDMPLTGIQTLGGNVSFAVTFLFNPHVAGQSVTPSP